MVLALRRPSNWFERLALAGAVLFVAHLVSRYDICFQDGEVQFFQLAALKDGPAFGWRDLRAALDTTALDGDYRPRVISYLAFIVTVKTRLALWQIVPPHPSFSPLWLLTVGVAPLLLYRFLRLELRDRGAALAGVAVYLVSAGFLSGVTMIFHPGKPLANVLVIGVFYLCARINATPVPPARLVATLLGLLTLAPFVDETAVFAWVVPFIWCSYCRRRWLVFAAPALLAVFLIVVVAPTFSRLWFDAEFDFLDYLRRMASDGDWGKASVTGKLSVLGPLRHARTLLAPGLLPWGMVAVNTPLPALPQHLPLLNLLLVGVVSAAATLAAWRNGGSWPVYRKLAILAALFFVFQTVVFVFHDQELTATGFYYGAIFSVLFAGLAAALYAGLDGVAHGMLWARLGLSWILTISAINFLTLNAIWMLHSNDKALDLLPIVFPEGTTAEWQALRVRRAEVIAMGEAVTGYESDVAPTSPGQSEEHALAMWTRWRANPADFTSERPLTVRDLWLVLELGAIR